MISADAHTLFTIFIFHFIIIIIIQIMVYVGLNYPSVLLVSSYFVQVMTILYGRKFFKASTYRYF